MSTIPFDVTELARPPPNYKFDPNTDWKIVVSHAKFDIGDPTTWVYIDEKTFPPDSRVLAPYTVYSPVAVAKFMKANGIANKSEQARLLANFLPGNFTTDGIAKRTTIIQRVQMIPFKDSITPAARSSFEQALRNKSVAAFLANSIKLLTKSDMTSGTSMTIKSKDHVYGSPSNSKSESATKPENKVTKQKQNNVTKQKQNTGDEESLFRDEGLTRGEELFFDEKSQKAADDAFLAGNKNQLSDHRSRVDVEMEKQANQSGSVITDEHQNDANDLSAEEKDEYRDLDEDDLKSGGGHYQYNRLQGWSEVIEGFDAGDPTTWAFVTDKEFGDYVQGQPPNPYAAYTPALIGEYFDKEGIERKSQQAMALFEFYPLNVNKKGGVKEVIGLRSDFQRQWVKKYATRARGHKRTHEDMAAKNDEDAEDGEDFRPLLRKIREGVKRSKLEVETKQKNIDNMNMVLQKAAEKTETLETQHTKDSTTIDDLTAKLVQEKQKSDQLYREIQAKDSTTIDDLTAKLKQEKQRSDQLYRELQSIHDLLM